MEKREKWLIFGIASLLIVTFLLIFVARSVQEPRQVRKKDFGRRKFSITLVPSVTPSPFPTKTEEEKEVIRKMETLEVKIADFKFDPTSLTIKANDQVRWVNNDNVSHQVTGKDWGGVEIRPGRNFTQRFEKEGTYSYYCATHPEMTGEIIVQ